MPKAKTKKDKKPKEVIKETEEVVEEPIEEIVEEAEEVKEKKPKKIVVEKPVWAEQSFWDGLSEEKKEQIIKG